MNLLMSVSLPGVMLSGFWIVYNTAVINAFMLRDLKVCKKTSYRLGEMGRMLEVSCAVR